MTQLSYRRPDFVFGKGFGGASEQQIRGLQNDLRQLGYLRSGIDGRFGSGTEFAVKALQHDLLNNDGTSTRGDGNAPVGVRAYRRERPVQVNGVVDQALVECISDILDDARFPKLPRAENPRAENQRVVESIRDMEVDRVPTSFLLAILTIESGLKHFNVPGPNDEDQYIVVGLDHKEGEPIVTSRGYGCGQYTLFHHPARQEEVNDFMLDPAKNVQKAITEVREKFDKFVNGSTPGTRADDRQAEIGSGELSPCKYLQNDPRFMKDCKTCLMEAGTHHVELGAGKYHQKTTYTDVPVRSKFGCDWPFAVRRYNGSGIDSYHYQAKALKILQKL